MEVHHFYMKCNYKRLKFANKILGKRVEFQRNKMNVKIAAQVMSNSVATAIEFLMTSRYPGFSGVEGAIRFRVIDRLFHLFNSKNPFITAAKSTRDLAVELFNDKINPFHICWHIISCKIIELLFSCNKARMVLITASLNLP